MDSCWIVDIISLSFGIVKMGNAEEYMGCRLHNVVESWSTLHLFRLLRLCMLHENPFETLHVGKCGGMI